MVNRTYYLVAMPSVSNLEFPVGPTFASPAIFVMKCSSLSERKGSSEEAVQTELIKALVTTLTFWWPLGKCCLLLHHFLPVLCRREKYLSGCPHSFCSLIQASHRFLGHAACFPLNSNFWKSSRLPADLVNWGVNSDPVS